MIHPREFALLQEVLQLSAQELANHDGGLLMAVRLQVGAAALILPDQLLSCWKTLVEGTEFSHVRLELEHVPLTLRCLLCRMKFQPPEDDWSCPGCHSARTEISGGNQVVVKEINVLYGYGLA
jgi:hydrogenase nickel incorporation protein HypA/HybF